MLNGFGSYMVRGGLEFGLLNQELFEGRVFRWFWDRLAEEF